MKVLVINCGSSSLKYQLIDMADESVIAKGLVERIQSEDNKKHIEISSASNYSISTSGRE